MAGFAILFETSLFIGLIIPGDTVVLVASTGVTDILDFFYLLGAVLLGSLIGESLGFTLGRLFGKRIRFSKLGQRLGEKNWNSLIALLSAEAELPLPSRVFCRYCIRLCQWSPE